MVGEVLSSPQDVVRCLITYTDWCQPTSSSIFSVGAARRSGHMSDGLRPGVLDTLDERTELARRCTYLDEQDLLVLFLWYVRQLPAADIAREAGMSRRQCYRRRSNAIQTIIDLGRSAA